MLKPQYDTKELRERLTPEQYAVVASAHTEKPYTGQYWQTKDDGMYECIVCGTKLFDSKAKYDSNCGWPSFYDVIPDTVEFREDLSYGMNRVEIVCKTCGAHLGHIFPDGPRDRTGMRYCVNSASLRFKQ